jgi:predicted DNA-binding transcriptional regulator YafY
MAELTDNPLSEASPAALQELFDLDPLKLTDDDLTRVVAELRAQRGRWEKAQPKSRSKAVVQNLDLSDLGL